MKKKTQKVTIITGASRGIGKAIALKLDKEDFTTVLVSRSQRNLKAALKYFKNNAVAIRADVSKEGEVVSMVGKVIKKFGRIDVLVNNAGLSIFRPVEQITKENFEAMVNVNLGGVFYCSREVIKQMKKQPAGGQIINISSIAAKTPALFSKRNLHCMVKAGIGALAESLQAELRNSGVKIVTIYPGLVSTELLTELRSRDPAVLQNYALKPEDIAHVVWMIINQGKNSNITEVAIRPLFNIPVIKK